MVIIMINYSIWKKGIQRLNLPKLDKSIDCDILIIGGGIAGISTAFNLKNTKQNIVVIDKDEIGMGISANTTGKLSFLQGLSYHKLEMVHGFEKATNYLKSQQEAIKIVKNNIERYQIDCDFQISPSITFTNDKNKIKTFEKERSFFDKANIKYQVVNNLNDKYPCVYGIKIENNAIFHPVKYIKALARICLQNNIKIFEHTKATSLTKKDTYYLIKTDKQIIKARKVIVTTHYPFFVIPGLIPLKTHMEKTYLTASKNNNKLNFNALMEENPNITMRDHEDKENYLIFGGYSHKLNKNFNYKETLTKIKNDLQNNFNLQVDYQWEANDVMTSDYLPLIGQINKNHPNLFIATGFNKWGMTNGVIAGKILSNLVQNKTDDYEELFSPMRKINIGKITSFPIDAYQNISAYLKSYINKDKSFYHNVYFKNIDGKEYGIYIDDKGVEHKIRNLCPHMKCKLIFNNKDITWDCPCHGSRFDIDGKLLEGPSVFDVK